MYIQKYKLQEEKEGAGVPAAGAEPEEKDSEGAGSGTRTTLDVSDQEPKTTVQATWPEDWRGKLAADEAEAKRLGRFGSPKDVWTSFRELEKKMSAGEKPSTAPPKDADEATLKKWRSEHGVPDTHEGYYDKLGDLVVGELDKPIADSFLKIAHEANLPPEQVKPMLSWYYAHKEELEVQRLEADKTVGQETEEVLREEWGPDYRSNTGAIKGFLNLADEDTKSVLMNARGPDGVPIMSHPGTLKFLRSMAVKVNPTATLLPDGGSDPMKGVEERIAEIDNLMKTNRPAYNRDLKMQSEYRELVSAREEMKRRSA